MEEKREGKYLGDIISTDGRDLKISRQELPKAKAL